MASEKPEGHSKANGKIVDKPSVLLAEEGDLSDQFYDILHTIFLRFAKLREPDEAKKLEDDREKVKLAALGREEINAFSRATNGKDLPEEQWTEIVEYLDVNDAGELTFKGFTELYSLQTENDEAETVKDLKAWGYDPETLERVEKEAEALEEADTAEDTIRKDDKEGESA
ncbi:EF-hand-like domain containing protein [Rhodotorula toruloides]|uniref:EF-hand-like domain containing protein n=1 Tax=Rhodotorula toruloides TaxID=5286 RepID=A0A511KGD8_RHOTO|nr:EF-hand-like domain containing protein [Rhodotorula toruloides]